jgi:AraC-like DNA-binding protein
MSLDARTVRDIFEFTSFLGASQSALLAFFLFSSKRGNVRANRCLAWAHVGLAILLAQAAFFFASDNDAYPATILYVRALECLMPILMYLYVRLLARPDQPLRKHWRLMFLPVAAMAVLFFPNPFSPGRVPFPVSFLSDRGRHLVDVATYFLVIAQAPVYIVATRRMLRAHERIVENLFSSIENINLRWLKNVVDMCMACYPLLVLNFLSRVLTFIAVPGRPGQTDTPVFHGLITVFLTFFVAFIGYRGLSQPEIFSGGLLRSDPDGQNDIAAPSAQAKPLAQNLPDAKIAAITSALDALMKKEKPYLNHGITLEDIAGKIGVHRNQLSQTINRSYGKNFFDFINFYRVGEIRRHLDDSENDGKTVIEIAYDCGFNSKTAFNEAFRKCTGITPTEYRKRQKANNG